MPIPVSPTNEVQARAIARGVDLARLPVHVAMIMDGNGRWATRQGAERLTGHWSGYAALRDVLRAADELGIGYLTVYAFSAENWRRPESEVTGLMELITEAARTELEPLIDNNVRVRVAGRLEELPATLRLALAALQESTREKTGIVFTLAINYGGRAEIVDAVRALVAEGVPPDGVTEDSLAAKLYQPDVPDPDLMIRTAGEMRTSNFLMWQSAYSELYVTEVTWPEFGEAELLDAVAEYQRRQRKFGGLAD